MVDFSIATLFYYDSVVVLLLCDYQSAITPVSIFVVPCIPPRIQVTHPLLVVFSEFA